jgi:hypothetical protein
LSVEGKTMMLDDGTGTGFESSVGTYWKGVDDRVMGGISKAELRRDEIDGVHCLRLTGDVRLENNGGFLQMALDISVNGESIDASMFSGLQFIARGKRQRYSVHLRTDDVERSWQSYRAQFDVGDDWNEVSLPFTEFRAHRISCPLNLSRLRRLGFVAIGRAFHADLAIARLQIV